MKPPWTFYLRDTVTSTMDEARNLIFPACRYLVSEKKHLFKDPLKNPKNPAQSPHDTWNRGVVLAQCQTQGRGRQGRSWLSMPGNLSASLMLASSSLPLNPAHHALSDLSFVSALALGESLQWYDLGHPSGLTPQAPSSVPLAKLGYKWPNDVMWGKRKIGGILLETHFLEPELEKGLASSSQRKYMPPPSYPIDIQLRDPDQKSPPFSSQPFASQGIIIGVGVNLNHSPKNLSYPTTSLRMERFPFLTPQEFLKTFLGFFDLFLETWLMQGFEPLRRLWMHSFLHLQETIQIQLSKTKILQGKVEGLDGRGCLILSTSGGIEKVSAGDILLSTPGALSTS